MNLHKHQLYLLEQHSEAFKIWSAIIRINTEGKSSIMNLGPSYLRISRLTILTITTVLLWVFYHCWWLNKFETYIQRLVYINVGACIW